MSDWIKIKSKYPNTCKDCQGRIEIDEPVFWKKGEGVKHTKCPPQILKENDSKIEIKPKEWKDFQQYSYKHLQTIINCQCCGVSLKNKDVWIEQDRKTCEDCHHE